MDAAATAENAKCERYLDEDIDALRTCLPWGADFKRRPGSSCCIEVPAGPETIWLNPPYSMAGPFVTRAVDEARWNGHTVVCLVYSKTDTEWFYNAVTSGACADLLLVKGRLAFEAPADAYAPGESGTTARTASCVLVLRPMGYRPGTSCNHPNVSYVDRSGKRLTRVTAPVTEATGGHEETVNAGCGR